MTSGKEDYLKALYILGEDHPVVSNKALSEYLKVSAPSVSEMIAKLQREGFLCYTAYRGSTLTEKGKDEAVRLLRFHGLWEVFLTRCLGYSWSGAHEEAERLEHYTSLMMAQRLDEYLKHPLHGPSGSAIPSADGEVPLVPVISLDKLKVGDMSRIRRVTEDKELMDYLQGRGIRIGMKFRLKEAAPYEGSRVLDTEEGDITISYKAACQIFVDDLS